ncbi:putative baseplate assembly protein [Specibacter cremeus]|uniref:putative baseplate assembly protein n=1 Tax=Specibacter cremeus TaxID=1629051 RepID=UPI000F7B3972|nr:putative baseplate assembly protein [Specibacter cremeus]
MSSQPCAGCTRGCTAGCPGVCTATAPATPAPTANPPGQPQLSYRVGTAPRFLAAMLARLSSADHPELAALATREPDDPAISLLDAWSVVADVLTFYQERIANEGYLRTATERLSIGGLAGLVGYRVRPGVAASTYLAYTIDATAGPVTIPAGAAVNSVPGPGETMQTFETSDDLDARPAWNLLGPRLSRPQTAGSILAGSLYLAGTATNLSARDPLLLDLGAGALTPARVHTLTPDPAHDRTLVTLTDWYGNALAGSVLGPAVDAVASAFGGAPESATAQRVADLLAGLAARAESGHTLAGHLRATVLPVLREELAVARDHGYQRLVPLLEATLAQTERLGALLAGMRAVAPAFEAEGGLDRLLASLRVPPSVPPAGPRQLSRSYAGTFAGGRDVYPKLLASLFTDLAPVLYQALAAAVVSAGTGLHVYALRDAASLFGHNAPLELTATTPAPILQEWDLASDEVPAQAHLDAAYDGVEPGSAVVVSRIRPVDGGTDAAVLVCTVKDAVTVSRSAYGMSGRSTTLTLDPPWWNPSVPVIGVAAPQAAEPIDVMGTLRASTVYGRQEELALADEPVTDDVAGNTLELDGLYDGLVPGRWATVEGVRTDTPGTAGVHAAELVMLAGVEQSVAGDPAAGQTDAGESLHTFLTFAAPLAYTYARESVRVHGNVVHATHGATHAEVLGGGNAAVPLLTFTLKAAPLTLVAAPTPAGTAGTLVVRVDDVAWAQAPGLAFMGPGDRSYLTGTDDAGHVSVTFGTGARGQRPPTGVDNVRAVYRSGLGTPGNVRAGQLSQLATRPLGATAVVNPIPGTGGADAEPRDVARANVPLAVAALDRLVSVPDYADFARTFAGVGKASAAKLTDGRRQLVQVTIAGAADIPIDATSDLYRNLVAALHAFGDPHLPLRVVVREPLALVLSAGVHVRPGRDWNTVEPAVRAALLDGFGFDAAGLGRSVATSAVIAAMAAVPGVDYVDLDVFQALDADALATGLGDLGGAAPPSAPVGRRVTVLPDRFDAGALHPAQLAWLRPDVPDALILNEVRP